MVSLESPAFVPGALKSATNPAPAQEANPEEEKKNATRIFFRSWEEGDKSDPWVDLKVVAQ